MEFVLQQYGTGAIDAIISGYRAGLNHDHVLISALGMDIDELEAAWIESLGSGSMEQAA